MSAASRRLSIVMTVIVVATLAACGRTTQAERIDALLDRARASGGFDGVVLVARNDDLIHEGTRSAGDAARAPLTADSVVPLGTIAGPFTAMGVLLLERDGRLSLDDPVSRYLPALPAFTVAVTLRNLLDHTSGIEDYRDADDPESAPRTNRDVVAWLAHRDALRFLPGRRTAYSGTDDVLLARVIERVTGQPYAPWLGQAIFGPLGMTQTRLQSPPSARATLLPGATAGATPGARRRDAELPITSDSALVGTAHDLLRWSRALAGRSPWPQPDPLGRASAYGWNFLRLGGERVAFQTGGGDGYRVVIWRDLVGGTVLVLVARQTEAARPAEVVNGILAILATGSLRLPR